MTARIDERTQFVDTDGKPIVNGFIYIGTVEQDPVLNPITIYSDRELTTVIANPQRTDSFGRSANKIWIPGKYSIKVEDSNNVQKLQDLDAGNIAEVGNTILDNVVGANTIIATAANTITSYVDGQTYIFTAAADNADGGVTLNIDSLGAKAIQKNYTDPLADMDFLATYEVIVVYNGENDIFQWVNSRIAFPLNNAVLNGAFDHWQRELTFAASTTDFYHADRWQFDQAAAWAGTISRKGTSGNYRCRVQRTLSETTAAVGGISTVFETANSVQFAGKNVTVSFIARSGANYSPTSNDLRINIRTGEGTDESCNPLSGFATNPTTDNTTVQITTSNVVYSATFAVPAAATQLSFQWWMTPVGTAGADDWFEIGEVKVEEGGIVTPFIRSTPTVGTELSECERFYYKTYDQSVFPGAVGLRGAGTDRAFNTETGATNMPFSYPTTMRVTPTVTVYATQTGTPGFIRNETAGTDITFDFNGSRDGQRGVTVRNTGAVSTNDSVGCHLTAEAEL